MARGQIELNSVGYDLIPFRYNGRDGDVHVEQIEIFSAPFRTEGRRSQQSVSQYDTVVFGPFTSGFGGDRSKTDGPNETHLFDATADTRWSEGAYLPLLSETDTPPTNGQRMRTMLDWRGELYSFWDGSSGPIIAEYQSATDTWGGGGQEAAITATAAQVVQDVISFEGRLVALIVSLNDHVTYQATAPLGTWTVFTTDIAANGLVDNIGANEDTPFGKLAVIGSELVGIIWNEGGDIDYYSSTSGTAWTSEISVETGSGPIGRAVYPGIDGADKLYVLVQEGLWEIDTAPATWTAALVYEMSIDTVSSQSQCLAVHDGKLWIGAQSGNNSNPYFVTLDTSAGIRDFRVGTGLRDSSLPSDMLGSVWWLDSSGPFLYAATGGDAASRNARVLCYNGDGWHSVYEHSDANERIEIAHVSSEQDGVGKLHLSTTQSSSSSEARHMEYPNTNPASISATIRRGSSGYIDTRQVSGGMPTTNGAVLRVSVDASDLSATNSNEYINADYAVNGAARAGTDLGDFLSGTLSILFASGAGVEARNATLRFNLHRDASTNTDTPVLHSAELAYLKRPARLQRYIFMVDIAKTAESTSRIPRSVFTQLETARDLATLPRLRYSSFVDTYVNVDLRSIEQVKALVAPTTNPTDWGGMVMVVCEEVL